jgi:hypothetical protein
MAPTTSRSALWACCLLAILVRLVVARPISAQTSLPDQTVAAEPAAAAKAGKILRAIRVSAPPVLDGRLDDEAWLRAESIEDFVQWEPDNMAALSQRTVIQVAYDERNLYIAAYCYEADPWLITAGLGRRDNQPLSDLVAIGFDPRHDHQTAYVF